MESLFSPQTNDNTRQCVSARLGRDTTGSKCPSIPCSYSKSSIQALVRRVNQSSRSSEEGRFVQILLAFPLSSRYTSILNSISKSESTYSTIRCRASNTLIIRYEHSAGTEFGPLLETVVLLLQVADSQHYMSWCSYLFSLVFMSYFPIQSV